MNTQNYQNELENKNRKSVQCLTDFLCLTD
nr:MAG TPA: hypothetical protein [Caudoviricetes sp.]